MEWNFFAKVGKELLIKPVLQVIPSYTYREYFSPSILIELEDDDFLLWSSKGRTSKGINWLSWDKLSCKEVHEGMGFCNPIGF